MFQSCKYCGRIHPEGYLCDRRPKLHGRKYDERQHIKRFRGSKAWKAKRKAILQRDNYMCQACKRQDHAIPGRPQYYSQDLQVHHIKSVAEFWDLRLEDNNLITLCKEHHELAETGIIDPGAYADGG